MTDRSNENLMRLPAVMARTGMSRTTIYRKIDEGAFPPSVPISGRMVAWYESDVSAWVADPMGWRAAA